MTRTHGYRSNRGHLSIARNVEANHADRGGIRHLLGMLQAGDSHADIGRHFGVSRERARQWANALGTTITIYTVHDDVMALARM